MDFSNQVVSKSEDGIPGLENAGESRFQGIEADLEWRVLGSPVVEHDLRPARRALPRLRHRVRRRAHAAARQPSGDVAAVHGLDRIRVRSRHRLLRIGDRGLDRRALAQQEEHGARGRLPHLVGGVGYRTRHWDIRADCTNINDQRPPVSESELGDAQYYLLPARHFTLTGRWVF
jgi:hypothetical protein